MHPSHSRPASRASQSSEAYLLPQLQKVLNQIKHQKPDQAIEKLLETVFEKAETMVSAAFLLKGIAVVFAHHFNQSSVGADVLNDLEDYIKKIEGGRSDLPTINRGLSRFIRDIKEFDSSCTISQAIEQTLEFYQAPYQTISTANCAVRDRSSNHTFTGQARAFHGAEIDNNQKWLAQILGGGNFEVLDESHGHHYSGRATTVHGMRITGSARRSE